MLLCVCVCVHVCVGILSAYLCECPFRFSSTIGTQLQISSVAKWFFIATSYLLFLQNAQTP